MRPPRDAASGRSRGRLLATAAAVGGVGAVWGLGLSRLLAEGTLVGLFFSSPRAVALIAIAGAGLALALWRLLGPLTPSPGRWLLCLPAGLPLLYVAGAVQGALAGTALLLGGAALALLGAWRNRPAWLLPALLGLVSLGLYLRTLLPSVGEADTLEFQVVAAQLGVAHPTGYPLYILLGKLFTLLPVGNVAWRVNLASAVFGAAAVVVVYGVLRRLMAAGKGRQRVPRGLAGEPGAIDHALLALLAALAFALSHTFWSQALVAEVYTLHNLLVAAILWLLIGGAAPSERGAGAARRWHAVFFVVGLSLTNHLTTALLLPAVVLALLWDRTRWEPGLWIGGAGLFLLGLSLYLFIPLRWPALHQGTGMAVGQFFRYVTGGQFHGALRLDGWRDPTRWRIVGRLLHQPFGWIGLGLAAVGAVRLAIRRRRALALTGVTFFAFVAYGLHYYVADIAVFLLPAHLVLALWMGSGAAALAELLRPNVRERVWRPIPVALFALLPLSLLWTNLPAVDRSQDWGGYAWGRYVLGHPLETDGAVLADPKKFAPLYYLQQVEGVRTDLDLVLLGTEELYQADLRRRLGEGQAVYLARYLPNLDGLYLRSVGPLVEVGGGEPDGGSASADARLDRGIQLLEADVEADPLGRSLYHLTLHWRVEAPVDGDYVVRLRLVDRDGRTRWATDGVRPVNGLYPTNAWRPGAPISDYHEVGIPAWLPPGAYSLQVGLFPPFGGEGLPWEGEASPWLPLTELDLEPPSDPEPLPHARRVSFEGGTWLTGVDAPDEAGAGAPLTFELAWRDVAEDQEVRLSWTDNTGAAMGQIFTVPLSAGQVHSRHTITTPGGSGLHTLRVGLAGRSARCRWLAPRRDACPLLSVDVVPAGQGLANFGDRVLLTDAGVGKEALRRGEVLPVTLHWRGLRAMEDDYTVFVHLVGPDGRLHGQADSWPVQGSYPTSQWEPGREIADSYRVRLDPDAPSGAYTVQVGLYRLETMERLRVLNEAGEPVADTVTVATFDVPE